AGHALGRAAVRRGEGFRLRLGRRPRGAGGLPEHQGGVGRGDLIPRHGGQASSSAPSRRDRRAQISAWMRLTSSMDGVAAASMRAMYGTLTAATTLWFRPCTGKAMLVTPWICLLGITEQPARRAS